MKFESPFLQTRYCVSCQQPPKTWCGHVLKNQNKITAGWCKTCWIGLRHKFKQEGLGYYGPWKLKHGLQCGECNKSDATGKCSCWIKDVLHSLYD